MKSPLQLNSSLPLLALLLASILWSTLGVLIKTSAFSALPLAGLSCGIACIIQIFFLTREGFILTKNRLCGALMFGVHIILFLYATKLTTAMNAIFLEVCFGMLSGILVCKLLSEPLKRRDIVSLVAVLLGLFCFFFDKIELNYFIGNCLGALSGLTVAGYNYFLKRGGESSPLSNIFYGNIFVFLVALPVIDVSSLSLLDLKSAALMGIFGFGIPFVVYCYAVSRVPIFKAFIITTLEPILSPVWTFLLIGEHPGPLALIGASIVLITLIVREVIPFSGYQHPLD